MQIRMLHMWDDLKCFIFAVEAGSLSGAATKLEVSTATVSRRVDALERKLGLRLLNRQISGVELTVEGTIIYQATVKAADKLLQVERIAAGLREDTGTEPVVLSSTEAIISEILAPNLPELWNSNPQIRPVLSVSTRNVSIAHRDADIAIRLARPSPDNVVIRRLPAIVQGLYASADYLYGRDPNKLDFSDEKFLGMDDSFGDIPEAVWLSEQGLGQQQLMRSSSVRALCNAAQAGCGIALIPGFMARNAGLVEIPASNLPIRFPFLVFHRDFKQVKRVKVVREWIMSSFEKSLA